MAAARQDGQRLAEWLERLEARAPEAQIELGLERVRSVLDALDLRLPQPVITVAGTNGKGSVVALLEAMLLAAGYRPLAYTSPHLLNFSERMRIAGQEADARSILAALERVEQARADVALTYFEQVTLAALVLAETEAVDVLILEVGLGGRLDAVNVLDADVGIITSISVDHVAWLGHTREEIALEKAGIARTGRPLVLGEARPPAGLLERLDQLGALCVPVAAHLQPEGNFELEDREPEDRIGLEIRLADKTLKLPLPALPGTWQRSNAAAAVLALMQLQERLPVPMEALARGLEQVRLPGRCQQLAQAPEILVDVAHNEASAQALAAWLGPPRAGSIAIFSALKDKDVAALGRALDACFTRWLVAPLDGPRGSSAEALVAQLRQLPVAGHVEAVESVAAALKQAREESTEQDRIVAFGSFLTAAQALEAWGVLANSSAE